MNAVVYKSTGSWYVVKGQDGKWYNARIKGKFKIDDITSTNPITVGDRVDIELEDTPEQSAVIIKIYDRDNYINRQSPSHKGKHHIIAANIDQALLICTLREPRTSQGFIDRFLVAAEAYHIPAQLIFNKSDLYKEKQTDYYKELKEMYEKVGYPVFLISVIKNEGADNVRSLLLGKTTLISGHSGVGKSSFINWIAPSIELRTQKVSTWSGKGLHTTTFAEMFDLPFEGRIIDTPGIREFGLADISRNELSHYFPEMRELLNNCQFNNCMHINEPGCAVKEAVEKATIHPERYLSYCTILDSIEESPYR